MVLLYDPTAPRAAASGTASRTLDTLQGKVIGFIDNAKPNFDQFVDALADLLIARYGVARVVRHRKRSASIPAEAEAVDELAAECDLVVTGSGD